MNQQQQELAIISSRGKQEKGYQQLVFQWKIGSREDFWNSLVHRGTYTGFPIFHWRTNHLPKEEYYVLSHQFITLWECLGHFSWYKWKSCGDCDPLKTLVGVILFQDSCSCIRLVVEEHFLHQMGLQ